MPAPQKYACRPSTDTLACRQYACPVPTSMSVVDALALLSICLPRRQYTHAAINMHAPCSIWLTSWSITLASWSIMLASCRLALVWAIVEGWRVARGGGRSVDVCKRQVPGINMGSERASEGLTCCRLPAFPGHFHPPPPLCHQYVVPPLLLWSVKLAMTRQGP